MCQRPASARPTGRKRPASRRRQRLRNYFLTGLIVAGPLSITVCLIWSFVTWVDDLVRPFIPVAYRPETYLPFKMPGSGLIIALLALTLLGFLTANLVGRTLVEFGESMLSRMPIVRPIYKSLKQIFETLFSKSGSSFRTRRAGRVSGARHVVAGVPLAAAERRHRRSGCRRRRSCLGLHAVHAEPDHRISSSMCRAATSSNSTSRSRAR